MNSSIPVSGTDWRYHVIGEGDQNLLLLAGSLGINEGIASYIGKQLTGCRLVVPEYAPVKTVQECLIAFDRILNREGIHRFAVLGGSFGGLIAQAFAQRHPGRITHLILSGTGTPDSARVSSNERMVKVLPWIPVSILRLLLKPLLRAMVTTVKNPIWMQEYSRLINNLSKADIESRYRVAIDLDRSYRFDASIYSGSMRVLILEGEKDRFANQRVRTELRNLYPNAQVYVFRGAGHSAMMTHTDEWVKVVDSFLKAGMSNEL